jgi:hypothetical protein
MSGSCPSGATHRMEAAVRRCSSPQLSDCGSPLERLGGGREDARLPARESVHVRHEHLELLRRIAEDGVEAVKKATPESRGLMKGRT